MPLTVDWAITLDGQNYTSRFNPYVMEIEVQDQDGTESDTARITLADDGRLLVGKPATTDTFRAAAEAELAEARPLRDNGFKVPLAIRTITAVLGELAGDAA